jgi:hypothetical protein
MPLNNLSSKLSADLNKIKMSVTTAFIFVTDHFNWAGYKKGYQAGQAELFQAKRVSENTTGTDDLQCRNIIVQAEPLMFLLDGFKEATTDVYQLNQ